MSRTRFIAVTVLVVGLASPAGARRGLSPAGRELVRRIRQETGYVLHDRGPRPNVADRLGWTDGEVRRMHRVLSALPPKLRHLEGPGAGSRDGYFITRDAMSEGELRGLLQAERSLRDRLGQARGLRTRLGLRARISLVRALRGLGMGTVFGNAYFDRPEIRLYSELFRGSRLPGLRKMLAFTTVHEIGHQELARDAALQRDWRAHYESVGRSEYASWCGYAAGSEHEGYGVGIGTFAVAPKLLRSKAPRTYKFFVERFGADAFRDLRGGPTERWAIQLTYGLGDLLTRRAGRR